MANKTFFNTPWGERSAPERIIILVGGSVALFVAYRQLKNIVGFVRGAAGRVQTGSELGALQSQSINPTYTNTQYSIFANGLYSAMANTWFDYGTDEDAIKNIMQKMKNDADVLKLIQAFGTRDGYDLTGWLTTELNTSDMQEYVNGPLTANGITFQFQ